MVREIILGRPEKELKKLGNKAAIFIGKQYIKMGKIISLANKIMLDVNGPHVILIAGKRGSGKSYTMGVFAEGIVSLPENVSKNIGCIIFDTMGIYWTLKYPNYKDSSLLKSWELEPKGYKDKVIVWVPEGKYEEQKNKGVPVDKPFSLRVSEIDGMTWCNLFNIDLLSEEGVLIERAISKLKDIDEYSIDDIIKIIRKDEKASQKIKDAVENVFLAAKSWGLFSKKGTPIKDIVKGGKVSVLDLSLYSYVVGGWNVRALVIGLLSKKLMEERMTARKVEELEDIEEGWAFSEEENKKDVPLVWMFIDEAHEFLPKDGKAISTNSLIQVIREGRQPGISMVLATQQPGKIHTDVITQSDIVLSHRLTARVDISALNNIMQTYLAGDIIKYMSMLPPKKGSAIVLDDKLERIYPIQIRPRFTWHGGGEPYAIKGKLKL